MSLIDLRPDALLTATAEIIHERFAELEAANDQWRQEINNQIKGLIAKLDPRRHLRGAYGVSEEYLCGDRVCWNGAEWIARDDNPGAIPGEGWMLAAKRGKTGEKGERGERGEPGNPGPQGTVGTEGPPGAQGEAGTAGEPGRQGEAGERGKAGPAGSVGPPGSDGATIEALHLSETSLIAMRTDGVAIECDLKPLLERFRAWEGQ